MISNCQNQKPSSRQTDIFVLCKDCSELLCLANELRYREPNYLCHTSSFQTKIKVDYHSQKFSCKNVSCQRDLGRTLVFAKGNLRLSFMLDIKGIKFKYDESKVEVYKQWSKIPFSVIKFEE